MQKTLGLLVLLALLDSAAAAGTGANLEFSVPALLDGSVEASQGVRALIVFPQAIGISGKAQLSGMGPAHFHNHTATFLQAYSNGTAGARYPLEGDDDWDANWGALQLDFSRPLSSLYIEADRIAFNESAVVSLLHEKGAALASLMDLGPQEYDLFMAPNTPPDDVYAYFHPWGGAGMLRAKGVHAVAWFQSSVTCRGGHGRCPAGGGRTTEALGSWDTQADVERDAYESVDLGDAQLAANLAGAKVLVGGPALDLNVDGWMRLPLAKGSTSCATCELPTNQTLTASGKLQLHGAAVAGDGRMAAHFQGTIQSAAYDESPVDPSRLSAAAPISGMLVAATGAVVAAKFLIGALFTRHKRDPLAHPRRQALYAYVCAHPGATFREVAREVGLAAGTARHHLTVLKRGGLLVEHPYRSSVRFFENHGKFASNWRETVLLREPSLALLEGWIKEHAGAPQKEILDAMAAAHGWSRSTTQHRLGRLVGEGLAHVTQSGRLLFYRPGPKPGVVASLPARPMPVIPSRVRPETQIATS